MNNQTGEALIGVRSNELTQRLNALVKSLGKGRGFKSEVIRVAIEEKLTAMERDGLRALYDGATRHSPAVAESATSEIVQAAGEINRERLGGKLKTRSPMPAGRK